jgi:hypothetical protein
MLFKSVVSVVSVVPLGSPSLQRESVNPLLEYL